MLDSFDAPSPHMLLYRELAARWYRLVDPVEDHREEAACYEGALLRGAAIHPETLLELGAGAGNNAFHLKRRFRCTLTDISPEMQALSREQNPECEHVTGDMRSVRLERAFDLVFVHDAVMYITKDADLHAVADTVFVHTRPGGAALFAPDCVTETFRERTSLITGDAAGRSLRGLEWMWDPDPADSTFMAEYVFALREDGRVSVRHDRHLEGLFSRETWLGILTGAGFTAESLECRDQDDVFEVFLCRRQ